MIANKLLKNDFVTFLLRMGLLYVVLFICRIVFYLLNASILGPITFAEIGGVIHGGLVFDTVSILYVNCIFLLFSLLPIRSRDRRWYQKTLFWLYLVVNIIVIFLNFADAIYFHFVDKRFTAEEFHFAGNDNNTEIIMRSVLQNWYLVLVFVALVWGMIWCYKRIKYNPTQIKNNWTYYIVNTLIVLVSLVASVGLIRGGFGSAVRPITLGNANQYVVPQKASLILSNPFCMIRTIGIPPFEAKVYFDDDIAEQIFSPYHFPEQSSVLLGKRNIVVFNLESFGRDNSKFLNNDYFTEEETGFMPFLDSLMANSYTFNDAYSSGRKSIDAMPSILASIPSYKSPFALFPQALGQIDGLPTMLKNMGYNTSFFCGSDYGSMGFNAFGNQIGIDNHYAREDYEKACGTKDYDGTWGIWDEPFLQYMARVLDAKPEPFFANIFTLSSHHPFVVPEKYEGKLPKGKTVIQTPTAYTDLSLRKFFDYARNQPWFANTIFVFTSDHSTVDVSDERSRVAPKSANIVMFIYTPDGALQGLDRSVAEQADLMPTLLGLVGNEQPYFAFGTDVFNEPARERYVVTYLNGMYMIVTDKYVLTFDDQTDTVKSVFTREDVFQENNIYDPQNVEYKELENYIKAIVQSYGKHIVKMDFINQ